MLYSDSNMKGLISAMSVIPYIDQLYYDKRCREERVGCMLTFEDCSSLSKDAYQLILNDRRASL